MEERERQPAPSLRQGGGGVHAPLLERSVELPSSGPHTHLSFLSEWQKAQYTRDLKQHVSCRRCSKHKRLSYSQRRGSAQLSAGGKCMFSAQIGHAFEIVRYTVNISAREDRLRLHILSATL